MRIHEIRLHNFRAFEELELHLEPQLTVLLGRNGAGKTTVLEGLAVALGAWLSGFKGIHEDHPIPRSAAHLRTSEHGGVPRVESTFPVLVPEAAEPAQQREHDHRPFRDARAGAFTNLRLEQSPRCLPGRRGPEERP